MDTIALVITNGGAGRLLLRDTGEHFLVVDLEVATGHYTNNEPFKYEDNTREQNLIIAMDAFYARMLKEHFGGEVVFGFAVVMNPVDQSVGDYIGTGDTFEQAMDSAIDQAMKHKFFNIRPLLSDPVFISAVKSLKSSAISGESVTIALSLRST